MKADLYSQTGSKVGTVDVADRIFGVRWNADLVHQALRVQTANRRRPVAHAKGRGEVRGGGRKPWRQKGTGRARHGSIRSPIWVGGGVTHGPSKDKKYVLKINKKMRQKALFAVLSRRFKEGEVKIVEKLEVAEPKTKLLAEGLKGIAPNLNALVVVGSGNKNVFRAAGNLPKVTALDARALNVGDLLRHEYIVIEQEALDTVNQHYHAVK